MEDSDIANPIDERIAGFWRRAFAYITDLLIIQVLYALLLFVGFFAASLGVEGLDISSSSELILRLAIPFFLVYILLFLAYFTTFFFIEGQTPGKMVFGIRVVSGSGGGISLGSSLIRSMGYFVSSLFFGLGFLIALSNKKRRTLHDFISGSYVIRSQNMSEARSQTMRGQTIWLLSSVFFLLFSVFFLASPSSAELVDRIMAIVNNEVISLSDLKRHMALYAITKKGTDFEAIKRDALDELIDERLILSEAFRFRIEEPTEDEIKVEAKKLEKDAGGLIRTKEKLSWYGLEPEDLNELLKNRLIIERFIDQRINLFIMVPPEEINRYLEENKDRYKGLSPKEARIKVNELLTNEKVKERLIDFKSRLREKASIRINTDNY